MQSARTRCGFGAIAAASVVADTFAGGIPGKVLEEVIVSGKLDELIGKVNSASQGTVLSEQFENRPVLRPAEILEVVPGLIVTQHSGDGKASQYFLRGFNLDHGTDFATHVDGVPVNMPTHAHGQGYSDINFLIPELVERVEYKKGNYYAEEGDFSAAGAADIHYRRSLEQTFARATVGENGYRRAALGSSVQIFGSDLLLATQYGRSDGPWLVPNRYEQKGGLAKFTHGDREQGYAVTAMGYSAKWTATDQIPLRAVQQGLIPRFGTVDSTDGGDTHRYSLSAEGWSKLADGALRATAYLIDYGVELNSNFTYFTDPEHGDQFQQREQRKVLGGALSYSQPLPIFGLSGTLKSGVQVRHDDIGPLGLYNTIARVRWLTVREDSVTQISYGGYVAENLQITPWLQGEAGLRIDAIEYDVRSSLAANSGNASDAIASPKLTLIFGPWAQTEYFINAGRGFHSNDARGTTMTVDPFDAVTPTKSVSPLVRASGAEVGLRSALVPKMQIAASVWMLRLDSELTLAADASAIVATSGTTRRGLELGVYYRPLDWLLIDMDMAWTRARYVNNPEGSYIPNALEEVASVGITANRRLGWFGGARMRYFGATAISQDNTVRARPSLQVHAEAGYHFSANFSAQVGVFNVLDRTDADISYYYASQLRGESEPVDDIHFHPAEPRTLRATFTAKF